MERIVATAPDPATIRLTLAPGDRFEIRDGEIVRTRVRPAAPATAVQLALGAPAAVALAPRGIYLFHASGIRLADGGAIALTGASGAGKSPFAAATARAGLACLADDQLPVAFAAAALALPHWPRPKPPAAGGCPQAAPPALPLRARIALALAAPDAALHLEPLPPAAALPLWIGATVAARLFDGARLAAHFDRMTEAARTVPTFRLTIPRDHDRLPAAVAHLARAFDG